MSKEKTLIVELFIIALVIIIFLNINSPLSLSFTTSVLFISYVIFAVILFLLHNTMINIVRPLMMIVFSVIAVGLYRFFHEAKEKEVIKRTFETYFPPPVVKKIMGKSMNISTSGKKKEITVLFSDIKDFTKLSSEMNPDHIQEILNEYFETMTNIVFKYEGTLDKFIGDGLMVFFGDPENQPDHALRCVKAAIEMQEKSKFLNDKWEKEKGFPVKIRIGINTGIAVVGNMGSSRRLSYTALGSNVNLAQRLESVAPVGGILISQNTYLYVKDHVPVRPLSSVNLKGFHDPVDVYEIII
jgi:adenylate cyclase